MDSSDSKRSKDNSSGSSGYSGYSTAGYGYGYGYGYGGGDSTNPVQRSFQDYVLILRERIWYIVVVFLVVFSSALVFTLSQTKIYQSVATIQILRRDPSITQFQEVVDSEIRSTEDLNTQVKLMESGTIVEKVASHFTGEELKQFMAPYEKDGMTIEDVLFANRKIIPQRLTLIIQVAYQHPDRMLAAKVANLFVDEFIAFNSRVRTDESMKAVEDLKARAEDQKKKVEEMALKLQTYREKNKMVSLDQRKDIVTETLKALNLNVTQTSEHFKEAQIRWNQVQEARSKGTDLTDLPFIASQPLIVQLTQQLSTQKIAIAQLQQHYRAKHPKMIEAMNELAQTNLELTRAIDAACAQVQSDYETSLRIDREAKDSLTKQETTSLSLDRYGVEYENQDRELQINEQILQTILARARETSMTSTIETQNARIVDRAQPSPAETPVSPNVALNLALGLVGGLGAGLAFAFFVAFIDDRVKSSFDIESVVGLPLVGIIPQIKKMEQSEKAQIVVNNSDRQVSEAFLTLHSALRLKDESKNAKCILTTSTIPGEGKSFTTTNLALTFASHGEKVIVVDCDLRKPNIHKSFKIENLKGVIDVCSGSATLDDVIVKGLHPNLDVLPAGGRAKNPTQILNSKAFELMLSDLRKRYDRVFVDTPPLAAVSDALIILPLVDGSIFAIFFNKVRRKAAQFAAKKLLDANVPNFGAVLNGLDLAVSGYYYAQYYDKSYKDYYVVMSKEEEQPRSGKGE